MIKICFVLIRLSYKHGRLMRANRAHSRTKPRRPVTSALDNFGITKHVLMPLWVAFLSLSMIHGIGATKNDDFLTPCSAYKYVKINGVSVPGEESIKLSFPK